MKRSIVKTIRIMNKARSFGLILIAAFLAMGGIINGQDLLDAYLAEAAGNNPGLKSKFNEYMAALERVPQAGALPDPQVAFGYFVSPVETRLGPQKARFSASQMFPWFGSLNAREDVATQMAQSKYEEFREARSRLYYDVRSTWYNLYFAEKAIGITKENIDILNIFRKLALIKVEAGLASTVDVLRVEMETADLENQLALLKDNYLAMQAGFNYLLNVDRMRVVNLPDSLTGSGIRLTSEAIRDSIRNGNHRVLQMEFMQASYKKQEVVARKMGKPRLKLGLDYMVIGESANPAVDPAESGRDAFVFPMVGISVPLYRKKYTSMVRETVLMQESVENGKEDRINALEATYERADRDYRDAERRIPLFRGQSGRATAALHILEAAYENDGKNFEEVLRMERQLLKYNLELEKSLADKEAAVAFIDYLMGK